MNGFIVKVWFETLQFETFLCIGFCCSMEDGRLNIKVGPPKMIASSPNLECYSYRVASLIFVCFFV